MYYNLGSSAPGSCYRSRFEAPNPSCSVDPASGVCEVGTTFTCSPDGQSLTVKKFADNLCRGAPYDTSTVASGSCLVDASTGTSWTYVCKSPQH